MFKLIKWGVIAVVATAVVGSLAFGRHAGSYLHTAAQSFRDGVSDSIPVEFELERAENLIEDIEPQLEEALTELAQAHVDLDRAKEGAQRLEVAIARQEIQLRDVMETSGTATASFEMTTAERLRNVRLARTFDSYRANKRAYGQKIELIARQELAVEAAEKNVAEVRLEKRRLEEQIEHLRIEMRQLEAVKASSRTIELDDTALSRARQVLDQIENRIEVQRRLLESEAVLETPRHEEHRDVVGEMRAYFEHEETSEGRALRSR